MSVKIAIVEDDEIIAKAFESYVARYSDESGDIFSVSLFSDGAEITANYQPVYDIIFMDIQMKQMDGMAAAQKIRESDNNVIMIFITNMPQFAIKGYSVNALDFLLKPVEYFVFSQQLKKSVDIIKKRQRSFLLIPFNDSLVKVETSRIIYIESFKHQMIAYTKEKNYRFIYTMKELENELSDKYFFRCNNCYLVNLAFVQAISGFSVKVDKYALAISRSRKKEFIKALNIYVRGRV